MLQLLPQCCHCHCHRIHEFSELQVEKECQHLSMIVGADVCLQAILLKIKINFHYTIFGWVFYPVSNQEREDSQHAAVLDCMST